MRYFCVRIYIMMVIKWQQHTDFCKYEETYLNFAARTNFYLSFNMSFAPIQQTFRKTHSCLRFPFINSYFFITMHLFSVWYFQTLQFIKEFSFWFSIRTPLLRLINNIRNSDAGIESSFLAHPARRPSSARCLSTFSNDIFPEVMRSIYQISQIA